MSLQLSLLQYLSGHVLWGNVEAAAALFDYPLPLSRPKREIEHLTASTFRRLLARVSQDLRSNNVRRLDPSIASTKPLPGELAEVSVNWSLFDPNNKVLDATQLGFRMNCAPDLRTLRILSVDCTCPWNTLMREPIPDRVS